MWSAKGAESAGLAKPLRVEFPRRGSPMVKALGCELPAERGVALRAGRGALWLVKR